MPEPGQHSADAFQPASASPQRILWIDAVKGLCIFLVVQHHFIKLVMPSMLGAEPGSLAQMMADFWTWIDGALGPLRMPLFFFVSGLLLTRSLQRSVTSSHRRKRIDNLLWVYLVFSAVQWMSVNGIHLLGGTPSLAPLATDAIYADGLWPYLTGLLTGNTSLWYLYALVLYYLVARAFNHHRRTGLIVVGTVYLGLYLSGSSLGWGPDGIIHNLPFFVIAAYYGGDLISALQRAKRRYLFAGIALLTVLTVATGLSGYPFRFIGSLAAMLAALTAIAHFLPALGRTPLRWFARLGQYTLYIYVFHRIGIELLFTLGGAAVPTGWAGYSPWAPIWIAVSPAVVSLALCLACAVFGRWLRNRYPALFAAPQFRAQPEHNDRYA